MNHKVPGVTALIQMLEHRRFSYKNMMNKAYLNNYEDKNNPHNNKYNQIRIKKSDTTEQLN